MKRIPHSGIVQRFFRLLYDLEIDDASLGVAFSGGPDSTALALCAAEAVNSGKLARAVAIHVDHGVRGESASDAANAAAIANQIGIPYQQIRLELGPDSSEGEMRIGRYDALHEIALAENLDAVLTGHHQRDQAETVLLHLIRGTGIDGISGIAADSTFETRTGSLRLIRPLLNESPEELALLVAATDITPLMDHTNLETDKARNYVRHEILPRLREVNPRAEQHIAQYAGLIDSEDDVLTEATEAVYSYAIERDALLGPRIATYSIAIQRRVVRRWISERADCELTLDRIEAVREAAIDGNGGIRIELGGGWEARQNKRRFTLHKTGTDDEEHHVES